LHRLVRGLIGAALGAASLVAFTSAPSNAASTGVANGAGIAIPAAGTQGVAAPYPSTVNVAGTTGVVTDVRVRLTGLTHTHIPDLDILLVGPGGQSVILLSDAADPTDVANRDITFVDGQPAVPAAALANGRYAPTNVGAGDAFPAPAPAGPYGTTLDVFDGTSANGTWSLFVFDDQGVDTGNIGSFEMRIITGTAENETPITAGPAAGPANPYPSVINVAGLTGNISSVSVTLTSVTTTFGDDLDVMLVSPGGERIMLASDAGGSDDIAGSSITFQAGGAVLPDNGAVGPGVFAPANYAGNDATDTFPAPAPGGATTTDLTTLNGDNPNGAWQLFIHDDQASDSHTLNRGWSIDIQTQQPPPPPDDEACSQPPVTEDGFTDVDPQDNTHESNIDCIAFYGIAQGTGPSTYSPFTNVSRAQIATFTARMIRVAGGQLPANPPDAFPGDDAGPPHELSINQLAAIGVIGGNGETGNRYNVSVDMRRDHMASFLAGAYEFVIGQPLPAGPDAFTDDNGNPHEADINRLAARGVVLGDGQGNYGPAGVVSRSSMGSFLARTLDELLDDGATIAPI
jgi:subtilisin-like proprotein convertase family protein